MRGNGRGALFFKRPAGEGLVRPSLLLREGFAGSLLRKRKKRCFQRVKKLIWGWMGFRNGDECVTFFLGMKAKESEKWEM